MPFIDVVRVRSGNATAVNLLDGYESEDVSARAKGFLSMLEKFQDQVRNSSAFLTKRHSITMSQLPDLEFPVNGMAEGRILVPWERRVGSNLTMQSNDGQWTFLLAALHASVGNVIYDERNARLHENADTSLRVRCCP